MSQLWQDSTLLWSLMGDTVRGGWEQDFLNFSGENASLCDLPLWIFTVLKHLVCTLSSVQNDVQHMV